MEQYRCILQNRFFSGTSTTIDSNLQNINNYYLNPTDQVYKIVDFSNVRAFMANENNQMVVKAYNSFLSSSSLMNSALLMNPNSTLFIPSAYFKAIYYDDEMLADSFNNFYNTSISRGLDSNFSQNPNIFNTSIKNQLLDGEGYEFVNQDVFHNYFFWKSKSSAFPAYSPRKIPFSNAVLDVYDGDRNKSSEKRFVNIPTSGENYFINVFLSKRFTQTARMAFELCADKIFKRINSDSTFSQNLVDKIRYDDFFKSVVKGIDNYTLNIPGYNSLNQSTTNSTNRGNNSRANNAVGGYEDYGSYYGGEYGSNLGSDLGNDYENNYDTSGELEPGGTISLIQCFIDPNFKTNENEFWSDNPRIPQSSLANPINKSAIKLAEVIDPSSINKSKFIDTNFVTPIVNEILSRNIGIKLGGSYSLSKQGTIYRNQLNDLDFTIKNNFEKTQIFLDDKIIRNFNTKSAPTQLKTFIESILSAGLNIEKVIANYNGKTYLFMVYTNLFHIDLFLRTDILPVNTINANLLHYSYIFDKKMLLGRAKDLDDIKNFKVFSTPIPIEQNSLIRK